MIVLGCSVEPLRFVPPFLGQAKFWLKIPRLHLGNIQALTYSTLHSHSMNMFNRSFNQLRILQSCSLPFNNLNQAQNHRSGVYSSRYFYTTHSFNNYLHQIHSPLHMSQPSIACFYEKIMEDLTLCHLFSPEEYSSTQ